MYIKFHIPTLKKRNVTEVRLRPPLTGLTQALWCETLQSRICTLPRVALSPPASLLLVHLPPILLDNHETPVAVPGGRQWALSG